MADFRQIANVEVLTDWETAPYNPVISMPAAALPPIPGGTLYLEYGGDFVLSQTGGLLLATGWDEIRQAVERILFTNPASVSPSGEPEAPDYIFVPSFGTGLRRQVDMPLNQAAVAGMVQKIRQAVMQVAAVSPSIPPQVGFARPSLETLVIQITVTLRNGQTGTIPFGMPVTG